MNSFIVLSVLVGQAGCLKEAEPQGVTFHPPLLEVPMGSYPAPSQGDTEQLRRSDPVLLCPAASLLPILTWVKAASF